jgi:F-type H+-transporting ATPase subunit epsilon
VATELHVELVAVEEKVFSGEVIEILARTTEGDLGILAHHAPLLGQLAEPGEVRLKFDDGTETGYEVDGGFLSVTDDGVTILAEACRPLDDSATI